MELDKAEYIRSAYSAQDATGVKKSVKLPAILNRKNYTITTGIANHLQSTIQDQEQQIRKLLEEISTLKIITRRQEKTLLKFEQERDSEYVSRIRASDSAIKQLKAKLKLARSSNISYQAESKRLNEANRKLEEEISVFRSALNNQEDLDTIRDKLAQLEAKTVDLENEKLKVNLEAKNLKHENSELRRKLSIKESEAEATKKEYDECMELLKDKEKSLANLSMYRYRMIHSPTPNECPTCKKRISEEVRMKQQAEYEETLAIPEISQVINESRTEVKVLVSIQEDIPDNCDLSLKYFTEPSSAKYQILKHKNIQKDEHGLITIHLQNLETKATYTLNANLKVGSFYGKSSKSCTFIAECKPVKAKSLIVTPDAKEKLFTLLLQDTKESLINVEHVMIEQETRSSNEAYSISSLIQLKSKDFEQVIIVDNLERGLMYRFRCYFKNEVGSGETSEWTEWIELVSPPVPVNICLLQTLNKELYIEIFNQKDNIENEIEFTVKVIITGEEFEKILEKAIKKTDLRVSIISESLDYLKSYQAEYEIYNAAGKTKLDMVHKFTLRTLLPKAEPLTFKILSPTSISIFPKCPKSLPEGTVTGYQVYYSKTCDIKTADKLKVDLESGNPTEPFSIEKLSSGQTYYLWMRWIAGANSQKYLQVPKEIVSNWNHGDPVTVPINIGQNLSAKPSEDRIPTERASSSYQLKKSKTNIVKSMTINKKLDTTISKVFAIRK